MRRILYLAVFLAACAGGQTHDPGANQGVGGVAGISQSGGSGGSAAVTGGREANLDTPSEMGGAGGSAASQADTCGNGDIDIAKGEQCDGANLGGESCESLSEGSTGRLVCVKCEFDTSMCFAADTGTVYGE
jgi:hypothetical protein